MIFKIEFALFLHLADLWISEIIKANSLATSFHHSQKEEKDQTSIYSFLIHRNNISIQVKDISK